MSEPSVKTASTTEASRTQKLRDLIEGNACGMVLADELHNALLELETTMGWTLTKPTAPETSEPGVMVPVTQSGEPQ